MVQGADPGDHRGGHRRAPDLGKLAPERLIKETILNIEALIGKATLAATKANPKDKIASARLRMQGTRWLFELCQAIGILPQ